MFKGDEVRVGCKTRGHAVPTGNGPSSLSGESSCQTDCRGTFLLQSSCISLLGKVNTDLFLNGAFAFFFPMTLTIISNGDTMGKGSVLSVILNFKYTLYHKRKWTVRQILTFNQQ